LGTLVCVSGVARMLEPIAQQTVRDAAHTQPT
jgi:hypothetical protein